METLREKQSRFALMVARLLLKSAALGYEVTLGDAYRDERCPYGHQRSLHKKRLAIDLNLFKDGIFVRTTEGIKNLVSGGSLSAGVGEGGFRTHHTSH